MMTFPGQPYPLGSTIFPNGVNFAVFSRNATRMELLLFEGTDDDRPSRVIRFDPQRNRTFYYWHILVQGLKAGQIYAYRADGPFEPQEGHRFDYSKVLLDPYTRAVAAGAHYDRRAAVEYGLDNTAQALKSVVVDARGYDWEGDIPLRLPYSQTVIYEMHVGGFTRHPSSGLAPEYRGTYRGVIEKIPYLKQLGITAIELMPVQQFDPQEAPSAPTVFLEDGGGAAKGIEPGKKLTNYWGYSPVAFFAPHSGYATPGSKIANNQFRDMVKALHRAGIEVILDVVFNHTAEGNVDGPTQSLRGLENRAYYILGDDRSTYRNYSGCGNSLNTNHSVVRRMVLDCLRYWVATMHVDGFRFDLASVMARDEYGKPLPNPPILWDIESDPILSSAKIIAEAWDAAGLYQVGSFIGHRWAEWNGQFRDDVRRFVRAADGDENTVERLARRVHGSRDLYTQPDREPNRSINFVTCHDGFTLNDLVSYNHKYNWANGWQNRDGADANYSWDCDGDEKLRLQQIKNLLVCLFVAQGTPMLLMGDEIRRSQNGNNNTYCQDNELSWLNWDDLQPHAGLLRFIQNLIAFTQSHPVFRSEQFWQISPSLPAALLYPAAPQAAASEEQSVPLPAILTWHGVHLSQPDWSAHSHSLAFTLTSQAGGAPLHVIFNAYWEALDFELPPGRTWRCLFDTSLLEADGGGATIHSGSYQAAPRSSAILIAET